MVIFVLLIFTVLWTFPANAQLPYESPEKKSQRLEWWQNSRFGMFIHWGLYALAARHEWVKKNERIPDNDYQKYFHHFNPDLFNPAKWAKIAKQTGMKYAVITTKHHEGFCLFDSRCTDYKATKTPYGKDIIKEWTEAFRAEGLRIGFYYSLLDWHHPHYTIDRNHPGSASTDEEYDQLNKGRDMNIYRQYIKDQVRELLTNYGKIDIIWLDYSFPTGKHGKNRHDWDSENLLKMVRQLQPGIIVNDRLDLLEQPGGWDFRSPEQFKPREWVKMNGVPVPWETCQTFSGSWGYYRDELTWKDNKQLLALLIDTVSKGGNLLLNVGPTGRGTFDDRAVQRLDAIGKWMQYHSRSIYGCTRAPLQFKAPENTILTYNPASHRLYIHLLEWPLKTIFLEGYAGKVKYAQFLHDGSEIILKPKRKTIWMDETAVENELVAEIPITKPPVEVPVIELFLKD